MNAIKNNIAALALLVFASCMSIHHQQISFDHKHNKVIKGELTFNQLKTDTAFGWFNKEAAAYQPNKLQVDVISKLPKTYTILIFCGTWCGDTKEQVPRFYKILQQANFPESKVKLIGVDRKKHALRRAEKHYKIVSVPTFIFLENENELGRITETPKPAIEQDWMRIISRE
jgi:thiol-disulfide isomerase/thioredoxin